MGLDFNPLGLVRCQSSQEVSERRLGGCYICYVYKSEYTSKSAVDRSPKTEGRPSLQVSAIGGCYGADMGGSTTKIAVRVRWAFMDINIVYQY